MAVWCYILASGLGAFLGVYFLLEIHYFIRICICVILARFVKKKVHILETTVVTGICITNDIDVLLNHMNNARYLRELDFARVDFFERSKLYKTIVAKKGSIVQGATTIRYRRFIRVFSIFQITSRIIYWDEQSIYLEHRFVNPKDGFIHCVAVCKQRLIDCSAEEIMSILLSHGNQKASSTTTVTTTPNGNASIQYDISRVENGEMTKVKPEIPLDIAKWMEYNEISSINLRNGC